MATNFIQEGDVLTLYAPYDRTSGQGMLVGSLFGVALTTALSGELVAAAVEGVFAITKVSAQAWTPGQAIYWDDSAKKATTVASTNTPIGHATESAANPSSTGLVLLNYGPPGAAGPAVLNVTVTLTNGDSGYVVSPVAGTVARIDTVLLGGAITSNDAVVTPKIGAAGSGSSMTSGAITIANSGSAIGDKDSSTPSAANTVSVGDLIYFTVSGSPGASRTAMASILITP